jgi:hypothetical protein
LYQNLKVDSRISKNVAGDWKARQRETVTHHGYPPAAVDDLLAGGATAMPPPLS